MTIQAQTIKIDQIEAKELYRKYKEHLHYSSPIDDEIRRTYQLIAQGRVVIRALESIKAAGLNEDRLPKLALVRATAKECWFHSNGDGSAYFSEQRWVRDWHRQWRGVTKFPAGSFPINAKNGRSVPPNIPVHLRPRRGLANYSILWEAEWTPVPPVDPLLLRRIGRADLWLVVAGWDLTEVERACLATRMSA